MSVRHMRQLLVLACLAILIATALAVWRLAVEPVGLDGPTDARVASVAEDDADLASPPKRYLTDYAVLWQRDLLRPLYDPKPVEVVKKEPPPPKLEVTLEGTAVEPGFTYGLFKVKGGDIKFVSPGQSVGGAEVLAIGNGEARLLFHGREITLKVKAEGGRR